MELNLILANKRSASDFFEEEFFVYFLIEDEDVVYVGKTTEYITRIKYHSRNKNFDSYYLLSFDNEEDMSNYEFEMIAKYKPKYNKILPTLEKYPSTNKMKEMFNLKGWDFKRFLKKYELEPYVTFSGISYYELKVLKERGVI